MKAGNFYFTPYGERPTFWGVSDKNLTSLTSDSSLRRWEPGSVNLLRLPTRTLTEVSYFYDEVQEKNVSTGLHTDVILYGLPPSIYKDFRLNGWIYCDPRGPRWLIQPTLPSYMLSGGNSLSCSVKITRFGELNTIVEKPRTVSLSIQDIGQGKGNLAIRHRLGATRCFYDPVNPTVWSECAAVWQMPPLYQDWRQYDSIKYPSIINLSLVTCSGTGAKACVMLYNDASTISKDLGSNYILQSIDIRNKGLISFPIGFLEFRVEPNQDKDLHPSVFIGVLKTRAETAPPPSSNLTSLTRIIAMSYAGGETAIPCTATVSASGSVSSSISFNGRSISGSVAGPTHCHVGFISDIPSSTDVNDNIALSDDNPRSVIINRYAYDLFGIETYVGDTYWDGYEWKQKTTVTQHQYIHPFGTGSIPAGNTGYYGTYNPRTGRALVGVTSPVTYIKVK
jgi:hypothetical protein